MKSIGIDIGTTSISGVLFDQDTGNVLRSYTENSNAFISVSSEWEKIQSVDRLITLATDILDRLLEEGVVSIGITGQMHGILYFDADGKAVSPLYTWQDKRGDLPYKDTTYAAFLGSFSGYGNVTDFYNRENGVRPKEAVGYATVHDYFAMRICGLKRPLMHASDAASLGCYDLLKESFSYDCGTETVSDYQILGEYKGIPVSIAVGDNQASVFSTLASEDDLLLNVGTGSQVSLISKKPIFAENIETRPYFEGKYLVVGSALCGGRAYSLLKNFYKDILQYIAPVSDETVYKIMNDMLEKETAVGLTVDTRFSGTRSNPVQKGSVLEITTQNFTPPALTKGFLSGMTKELFDMYRVMGCERKGLVGSGNGIRKNPHLVRICEETFKMAMKTPMHLEEAAIGAAMISLVSVGAFSNAKSVQKAIRYERITE